MGEFKRGKLKSGSGGKVKNRKQAIAIALSEQRKQGGKMPSYYNSKSSKPKKTKVKKYQGGGPLTMAGGSPIQWQQGPVGQRRKRDYMNFVAPGAARRQLAGQAAAGGPGRNVGPGMKGGGSVNQLIDKKFKHGGRIPHNPSTINP